jgi:uncharacterized phage protein (TIGR02218 family)
MPGFETALAGELTSLAILWKLVRRDGVALGFTTHDQPLVFEGMRYESAPGMAPSAIVSSDALEVDAMEVAGALSADAITAADLRNGRFDGAAVQLFMVDWRDPAAGRMLLASGNIGTIEAGTGSDRGFSAAIRGPTAVLEAGRIETYSPECRAELGDWRCRVSMRGRSLRSVINDAAGGAFRIAGLDAANAGNYLGGRLRLLSGQLAGVERGVVAVEADAVRLDEPLAVAVGDAVMLVEGCDKQFATCAGRFGNAPNFRGEPHVPGSDLLTRFGGF